MLLWTDGDEREHSEHFTTLHPSCRRRLRLAVSISRVPFLSGKYSSVHLLAAVAQL